MTQRPAPELHVTWDVCALDSGAVVATFRALASKPHAIAEAAACGFDASAFFVRARLGADTRAQQRTPPDYRALALSRRRRS